MKNIWLLLLFPIFFSSCYKKKSDIQLIERYYLALNNGDYKTASSLVAEQFVMRENKSNYEISFDIETFRDWFQWDSVFNPSYEILSSERVNDTVHIAISKKCDRIMLFNEAPLRYLAYFEISNGRIKAINRYSYLGTDWQKWTKNKERFLQFVNTELKEYTDIEKVQNLEFGNRFKKAIQVFQFYDQHPITLKSPHVEIRTLNLQFDENGIPSGDYYLYYNDGIDSLLIDKEYSGNLIEPEQYSEYNIPDNAITALHSYWAGVGLVHYVVRSDAKLTVFKCAYDEMEVVEAGEGENPFRYEKFRILRIK